MSTTTILKSQLDVAKAELERSLAAGKPTRAIRSEIARIEAELAEVHSAEAGERRAQEKQEAATIQVQGAELAGTAQAQIEAAIDVPELAQLGEDVPAIEADPVITAAAGAVAQARAAVSKAERALAPHQAAADKLQTRINEERSKVAAIKERRSAGDRRDDDAGSMTLLADDIADLERLLSAAQAKVTASRQAVPYQDLTAADARLSKVQGEAQLRYADERLKLAEKAFLSAYAAQRAAERAAGKHLSFPSGTYRASTELKNIVSTH
jgi:hypothetical protein